MGWDRILHLLSLHAMFAALVFVGAWLCCLPTVRRELSVADGPHRRFRPKLREFSSSRPERSAAAPARPESSHAPGVPVSARRHPAAATSFPATFPADGGPFRTESGPPHLLS